MYCNIEKLGKKKLFIGVFSTLMILMTTFCFTYYSKQATQINTETTQIIKKETEILNENANVIKVNKPVSGIAFILSEVNKDNAESIKESIIEAIEEETTKIETETKPVRYNTLYYINDNGYNAYLENCYQDHLYNMCVKYCVEEYYTLLFAQMYHESSFRPNLISGTNDYGLMQINKSNHKWLGKLLGNNDFLDPYNNIEAGVYMMSTYLHKYNDVEKALVCYNMGEGAVRRGTYSTDYSKGVLYDMNLLVELN